MHAYRFQRRGASVLSVLATLFLILCLLIAGFAVVGYAAGWVKFQHDETQEKTTIELETGEVKRATEEAVDQGRKMLNETGEQIQEITDTDDEAEIAPAADPDASNLDADAEADVEPASPRAAEIENDTTTIGEPDRQ